MEARFPRLPVETKRSECKISLVEGAKKSGIPEHFAMLELNTEKQMMIPQNETGE